MRESVCVHVRVCVCVCLHTYVQESLGELGREKGRGTKMREREREIERENVCMAEKGCTCVRQCVMKVLTRVD